MERGFCLSALPWQTPLPRAVIGPASRRFSARRTSLVNALASLIWAMVMAAIEAQAAVSRSDCELALQRRYARLQVSTRPLAACDIPRFG